MARKLRSIGLVWLAGPVLLLSSCSSSDDIPVAMTAGNNPAPSNGMNGTTNPANANAPATGGTTAPPMNGAGAPSGNQNPEGQTPVGPLTPPTLPTPPANAGPPGTPPPGLGTLVPCAVDSSLPPEPKLPTQVCATLQANQAATSGVTPPSETTLDTARLQAAIDGCGAGNAVKLVTNGNNNAFISGPLVLAPGVTLWVDTGATLYGSRQPLLYGPTCGTNMGSCPAWIQVRGAGSAIVGDGVIDGQGGEKMLNPDLSAQAQSWWELSDSIRTADANSAANPAILQTTAASTNFVLYKIALHNPAKFHVRLGGTGQIVWGVTLLTPSTPTNSLGAALSPYRARNTDGIDPGAGGAIHDSYILYSKISVGDDQIAIKGSTSAGQDYATNLVIAHNRMGSGHGMSIGSETVASVHDITVCDLTIDNSLRVTGGSPSEDVNGIRIKSDPTRGGLVDRISYSDVCIKEVNNPIVINPFYSATEGTLPPTFNNISLKDVFATSKGEQTVTLFGLDPQHISTISLDNITLEGPTSNVEAQDATVALGPGGASFAGGISGNSVTLNVPGTATPRPIDCSGRWVSIP